MCRRDFPWEEDIIVVGTLSMSCEDFFGEPSWFAGKHESGFGGIRFEKSEGFDEANEVFSGLKCADIEDVCLVMKTVGAEQMIFHLGRDMRLEALAAESMMDDMNPVFRECRE